MQKLRTFIVFSWVAFCWTGTAWATQSHAGKEGLYAHQIAHLIFLAAMLYLCARLIGSGDYSLRGWRWIFVSALLFCLWNLDTLFVHAYSQVLHPEQFLGTWSGLPRFFRAESILDLIYYLARFDHLLSLPALLFLFLGIRTLLKEQEVRP